MTKFGSGKSTEQEKHDMAAQMIKQRVFEGAEEYDAFLNIGEEKGVSAGVVEGEELYPDIVGLSKDTKKPVIIGEVETEESVSESQVDRWKKYASLGLTFCLYVPEPVAEKAANLIASNDIKAKLRSYKIVDDKIVIKIIYIF